MHFAPAWSEVDSPLYIVAKAGFLGLPVISIGKLRGERLRSTISVDATGKNINIKSRASRVIQSMLKIVQLEASILFRNFQQYDQTC